MKPKQDSDGYLPYRGKRKPANVLFYIATLKLNLKNTDQKNINLTHY